MNENENMEFIAEEAFIKSPKKARQRANSVLEEYIDDFEELISKIRMKHDKALPLARTLGSAITDETLDKSKKDLEKVLRRYRSLTIGKLEELKEEVDDIKNPLKADEQCKAIIDRADEIHDERYSEIKEFLDKYKPIWVRELATESVEEAASEVVGDAEEHSAMGISAEEARKITDIISNIKKMKPEFEKAKKDEKAAIKAKYTKALNIQRLDGYMSAVNGASSAASSSKDGELYNHLREPAEVIKSEIENAKNKYAYFVDQLNTVFDAIKFEDYRKSKSEDPRTWIKAAVDDTYRSRSIPSIDACVTDLKEAVKRVENVWTEKSPQMNKATQRAKRAKEEEANKQRITEHRAKVQEELDKKKKNAGYNAMRAKENSKEYQDKLREFEEDLNEKEKSGEINAAQKARMFKEWRASELGLASYNNSAEGFGEAMEGAESGDIIAFVGGALIGSLLFNGLIARKEDVADKSIPGAKAYRYLLNDDFLKAEKSMKKIMNSGRTFEVNKTVAREIHSFKNEYYRPVAYTINKFLDYYDKIKPELFKEKKYYFDSPNTVRDEAIYKKIRNWQIEFYASGTTDMEEKAREINTYSPAYDMGTDCDTIRVDAKFLNDILNIDKTFAVLKVLEEAIGKLPDPQQIILYDEHNRALAKYHLPVNPRETSIGEATSPLHAYIMFEYLIAERMKRIRDMFIQYLSVVYDILNYTRFVDKK